jgi:hypothetical protein
MGLEEKRQFFSPKIAEYCDYNIDHPDERNKIIE